MSSALPPHLVGGLDDPVGTSLRTRHAHLARRRGEALAYDAAVATFVAAPSSPGGWDDLAALLGPGGLAELFTSPATPPSGWQELFAMPGVQYVAGPGLLARAARPMAGEVVTLGPADVPEMLALAELTRPGPFWPRTHEMGTYLGVRDGGRLLAMAGERMRPPGGTEVSAVCTHPDARGLGLASRLVTAVAAGVAARGELPFLHVIADNARARSVYESLGMVARREVVFRGFRVPA